MRIRLVDGTDELFLSFFGAPSKKAPDGREVGATIGLLNYDEAAVLVKFGVWPASIPHWLVLVGGSADGYPGLSGWGQSLRARCSPSTNTSSRFPKTIADGAWEVLSAPAE